MRLQVDAVEASLEIMKDHLSHKTGTREKVSKVLGYGKKRFPALNIAVGRPGQMRSIVVKTNHEFVIQALYTYFTEYLRGVLRLIYDLAPMLVAGKYTGSLSYIDIAKMSTYGDVKRRIVDDVFRKLENERSTSKLISGVLKGTSIEVKEEQLMELLMYMELRHILVHRAGMLDQVFLDKYEEVSKQKLKVGGKMPINIGIVRRGIKSVEVIATQIDQQLMEEIKNS